jgi:hypothetical protein
VVLATRFSGENICIDSSEPIRQSAHFRIETQPVHNEFSPHNVALPFICGMLPLIGGQSVTPFLKPAVTSQPIFTPLCGL